MDMPKTTGAAPERDRIVPGTVIDSFTVRRQLGKGAMGEVWLAEEAITGRRVALKRLSSGVEDAEGAKRFEREISLIASLVHPHIATYAGHGRHRGRPYLAVEHIDGPNLHDWVVAHGPLRERDALAVALQVAQGMDYAHRSCQLIHRDLKPGNLILDLPDRGAFSEGTRVKIIDFGLSRGRRRSDFEDFGIGRDQATQVTMGAVLGTPLYMAPEQFDDDSEVTWKVDLYALGVTLFFLLTGRTPYQGSLGQVIRAHVSDPIPDPASLTPGLSAATRTLIMRAMAKAPAQRHSSWESVVRAIRSAHALRGTTRVRPAVGPDDGSTIATASPTGAEPPTGGPVHGAATSAAPPAPFPSSLGSGSGRTVPLPSTPIPDPSGGFSALEQRMTAGGAGGGSGTSHRRATGTASDQRRPDAARELHPTEAERSTPGALPVQTGAGGASTSHLAALRGVESKSETSRQYLDELATIVVPRRIEPPPTLRQRVRSRFTRLLRKLGI